jgi:arylsulfatase A-like enzyme
LSQLPKADSDDADPHLGAAGNSDHGTRALSDVERLFAAWFALAAVLAAVRLRILHLAEMNVAPRPLLVPFLPLALYQDLLAVGVLAWASWVLLRITRRRAARRAIYFSAWGICIVAATYAVLNAEVYRYLRYPLTYHLLVLSDHLRGIEGSVAQATTATRLAMIGAVPFEIVAMAASISYFAPGMLRGAARRFYTPAALGCLLLYFLVGQVWANAALKYPAAVSDPYWAFVSPLFEQSKPFVFARYRPDDISDFLPIGQRIKSEAALRHAAYFPGRQHRPLNVVMVVMESVGAQPLELYGAPYRDSPEMSRLANHAALFERIYASQPFTLVTMTALFCSIYPYHHWSPVIRSDPDIRIPGLAAVLAGHGYRTAFLQALTLGFNHSREFLRRHGFQDVEDSGDLTGDDNGRDDRVVFNAAIDWIKANRSKPFFVTLWTSETHHPYTAPIQQNYVAHAPALNRYLSAIHHSDELIGKLADQLQAMGLADDTLLVITGDHGEAFGGHGYMAHGWAVYNDETWVPLMIVNPVFFPRPVTVRRVGQHVDVPLTILDLLGIDPPAQWQGDSLFAAERPDRAYLFAGESDYWFGLVQGDLKFVYDATVDRSELYDMTRDPNETQNLSGDSTYVAFENAARRRLAAWVAYQNNYLAQFMGTAGGHPAAGGPVIRAKYHSPPPPHVDAAHR